MTKRVRWVNFYPPCENSGAGHPWRTTSWATRALADRHARRGRIARVRVKFSVVAGLGDGDYRTMAQSAS